MEDFIKEYKREIRAVYLCLLAKTDISTVVMELERYIREYGISVEDACDAIVRKHGRNGQDANDWKRDLNLNSKDFISKHKWLIRKNEFEKKWNEDRKNSDDIFPSGPFKKDLRQFLEKAGRKGMPDFSKIFTKKSESEDSKSDFEKVFQDEEILEPEPSYALDTLDADIFTYLLKNAKAKQIAKEMTKLGYDEKLVKKHMPRLSQKWKNMLEEKWLKLWIMQKNEDDVPSQLDWEK